MIKIFLSLVLIQCVLILSAQNQVDALRYSQFNQMGSARYNAMGGAFGALGADLSIMASNPAGIGVYRKSDFGFSLSWSLNEVDSKYNGSGSTLNSNSCRPSNAGFVIAQPANSNGWKFINYGFSYNQLADYNQAFLIAGRNTANSILDAEADKINGDMNPDNAANSNGYVQADAVFYDSIIGGYTNDFEINDSYDLNQNYRFTSTGYAGEYDFSVSGNYNDVLFVGGTFGIQHINYGQQVYHNEDPNDEDLWLQSLESNDYLYSKGTGINLKFGFIYKINQLIRIGGAVHTPTWYNFRDDYWTDVYATIDYPEGREFNTGKSPVGYYNWELASPWHLLGNAALVIGKNAILSADYEYVGYQGMKLSAYDYYFNDENKAIENLYVAGHTVKIGAEYRISMVSLRGGFGYYGSPFVSTSANADAFRLSYSGGIGVALGSLYFDFSYLYANSKEKYFMYNGAGAADLNTTNNRFTTTLGFRF